MQIQTLVGQPAANSDGSAPQVRAGRLGDLILSHLHGRYYEQASRQNLFSAMLLTTSSTIAAGNIHGAAAAASTQFALWNPAGSGVNMALLKVLISPISGTAPGGPVNHSWASGTPNASVGSRGNNNYLGGPPSKGLFVASAAGATLTGAPNALQSLRPMDMNLFAAAMAATTNIMPIEFVEGDIVLPPGTMWVPTWSGAGTTFLNGYGVSWEEVPI